MAGEDTLILRGTSRITFSVLKEWTNLADPSTQTASLPEPNLFDLGRLLELVEIVQRLETNLRTELTRDTNNTNIGPL